MSAALFIAAALLQAPLEAADVPAAPSLDDLLARVAGEAAAPAPPSLYAPPLPPPADGKPFFLSDASIAPDGPRTDGDVAYRNRMLGAFQQAQGAQGRLDGRWLINRSDGSPLLTLQLSDPGLGESRIEGAWRKANASTGPNGSGFVDSIARENDELVLRFADAGVSEGQAQLRLREAGENFTGHAWIAEGHIEIVMRREPGMIEALARLAPPPPPPPKAQPAKAKPKAKKKAAPKKKATKKKPAPKKPAPKKK